MTARQIVSMEACLYVLPVMNFARLKRKLRWRDSRILCDYEELQRFTQVYFFGIHTMCLSLEVSKASTGPIDMTCEMGSNYTFVWVWVRHSAQLHKSNAN